MIVAGGTGGHVYPALATAKYFRKNDIDIVCAGRPDSFEKTTFESSGFKYLSFRCYKFPRGINIFEYMYSIINNILGLCNMVAYMFSRRGLGDRKIDFVLCFGGYISVPAAFAAFLTGIPVYLHEQNSYPGLANRLLSLFADKVFLAFLESKEHFIPENTLYSGNPLRFTSRGKALEYEYPLSVFVMGGSLGSRILNENVYKMVRDFSEELHGKYFFHLSSGKRYYEETLKLFKGYENIVKVHAYIDNMKEMYQKSHIMVCRGGATTVSELMYFRKPSIIIPGDFATGDHQRKNALKVKNAGGGVIICEKDFNSSILYEVLEDLDKKKYLQMVNNLVMISKVAAEKKIYQVIVDGVR